MSGRPAIPQKKGALEIDTLRGLAVLAVIWGHAVMFMGAALTDAGEESSLVHSFAGQVATFFAPLRMPLFTILSGWVYALRPASTATAVLFMQKKIRRLLIPLVFVSSIQFFIYYYADGTTPVLEPGGGISLEPHEFWKIWFFHYGHLWFLQALFLIFLAILVVDSMHWMNTLKQWLGWLALLVILPRLFSGSDLWSLNKMVNLAVFFFFGVGLLRFKNQLLQPEVIKAAWVLLSAAMTLYLVQEFGSIGIPRPRAMMVVAGAFGSLCLLSLKLRLPAIAWIGSYSYTIYLYQRLAFELHRLFDGLLSHGIMAQVLWFTLGLLAVVSLPIALDYLIRRIPFLRTLVLGKSQQGPAARERVSSTAPASLEVAQSGQFPGTNTP